jgi:hypothetical protein
MTREKASVARMTDEPRVAPEPPVASEPRMAPEARMTPEAAMSPTSAMPATGGEGDAGCSNREDQSCHGSHDRHKVPQHH